MAQCPMANGGWVSTHEDVTEQKETEVLNLRLARIVETSRNEVYVFDAETLKFLQVNASACENLGYTMQELTELTPLDLKPEYSPDTFERLIAPLRRGETGHVRFETTHRRRDGSLYDVDVTLQQIGSADRPVFAAIVEDITERLRADTRLRAQKALTDTAVNNLVQGLVMFDADARIALRNQRYIDMYGMSPDVVKAGCSVLELMKHRKEVGIISG